MSACRLVINTEPSAPPVLSPEAVSRPRTSLTASCPRGRAPRSRRRDHRGVNLDAFADEREMLRAEAIADARDTEPAPSLNFEELAPERLVLWRPRRMNKWRSIKSS